MRIAIPPKLKTISIILTITSITSTIILYFFFINQSIPNNSQSSSFDGERALRDVNYQVELGARTPGSNAHDKAVNWIVKELNKNRWETEIMSSVDNGKSIQNIIGKKGSGRPWIILGAHYDSRIYADRDKQSANQLLPVPGANDGASGVAVLLELSRMFSGEITDKSWAKEIWLVFFDAEDNGDIPGWTWIMGSQIFAENLQAKPDMVVVLDMIGDADLNIYMEENSDEKYSKEIWKIAADLGYEKSFIPEKKFNIIDDHIPFIQKGIPAVDIIDLNYPYWHTVSDTTDKISTQSLSIVGTTIYTWLTNAQQP